MQVPKDIFVYVGISVHKQYSRLDTIFKYIVCFGPPGEYPSLSPKHRLSISGEVVGVRHFFEDMFLAYSHIDSIGTCIPYEKVKL